MLYFLIRIKENEEAVIKTVKEAETVESFTPLLEDIFTETLQLSKSKYSKTCLKRPLKKDRKLVFKTDYRLMQVKSITECSKGSILQYF